MSNVEGKSAESQILEAGCVQISKKEFEGLPVPDQDAILTEAWAMTSSMSPEDF